MTGCATWLPPAVLVQDIETIAGTWQGTRTSPAGSGGYKLTIKQDGSWEGTSSVPLFRGVTRLEGAIFIRNGKIFSLSRTSGISGPYILHEGDGGRILTYRSDDGSITSRLTPVN